MSYWHLLLQNQRGLVISEKTIHLDELPWVESLQERCLFMFIEGQPELSSTWKITQYEDGTQVRDKYICDLELRGASLAFSTSVADVRIQQLPLDPYYSNTSYLDIPFVTEPTKYVILLRDGDQAVFKQHDVTLKTSFVSVPKTEANVEVVSSALPRTSPVKIEKDEAETDGDDDDDLDSGMAGYRDGDPRTDTQNGTQGLYSTGRERQSVLPSTPYDTTTCFTETVHETPMAPPAPLQQQASTLSRVPDSLEYEVHARPAEIEESQLDGSTNHPTQLTQRVDHIHRQRGVSLSRPDNEGSSDVHVEVDDTADPMDGIAAPLDVTSTGDFNAEVEPVEFNAKHAQEEDQAEHDGVGLPETADAAATDGLAKEGYTASEGDESEPSDPSASAEENKSAELVVRTPGTKRKVGDIHSTATTQSKKRVRRTEADRLAINNGTPNESPLSNPTQRRFSPRVMVSPSAPGNSGRSPLRVLFPSESTILQRKGLMNFLRGQKVKQINDSDPKSFDILCVEKGELKTTAKLLVSLLHNKTVVTDEWVVHSAKAKSLLDFDEFLPEGLKASKHRDRSKVFENMNIYFTPKLRSDYKKGWDDIHSIVEQAGAAQVFSSAPSKLPKGTEITLYLGSEKSDSHVASLQAKGVDVFSKDIISHSILKGELVLDKEKYGLEESSKTPTSSAASASTADGKEPKVGKAKASRGKGKKK